MCSSNLGLLLLHALPLDSRMWEGQRGILPDRTFAPDLYGCGDTLQAWAEHCVKHVPTRRFVIVGCSVGGSCALEILRLVPDRVAATVLIGTKARHDPDPRNAQKVRDIIKMQGVEAAWQQLWQPLFALPNHSLAHDFCRDIALDQSSSELVNGVAAFHTRFSREDVVASSASPIHVVSGELDAFPGVAYSRRLAQLNSAATLYVLKACGHYTPVVKPEETSAIIANVVHQVAAE